MSQYLAYKYLRWHKIQYQHWYKRYFMTNVNLWERNDFYFARMLCIVSLSRYLNSEACFMHDIYYWALPWLDFVILLARKLALMKHRSIMMALWNEYWISTISIVARHRRQSTFVSMWWSSPQWGILACKPASSIIGPSISIRYALWNTPVWFIIF